MIWLFKGKGQSQAKQFPHHNKRSAKWKRCPAAWSTLCWHCQFKVTGTSRTNNDLPGPTDTLAQIQGNGNRNRRRQKKLIEKMMSEAFNQYLKQFGTQPSAPINPCSGATSICGQIMAALRRWRHSLGQPWTYKTRGCAVDRPVLLCLWKRVWDMYAIMKMWQRGPMKLRTDSLAPCQLSMRQMLKSLRKSFPNCFCQDRMKYTS